MNLLSWLAFFCYVLGLALGARGVVLVVREGRVLSKLAKQRQWIDMQAFMKQGANLSPTPTHEQFELVRANLTALVGDTDRRARAVSYLVAGVTVEFAGNLLSLPW